MGTGKTIKFELKGLDMNQTGNQGEGRQKS